MALGADGRARVVFSLLLTGLACRPTGTRRTSWACQPINGWPLPQGCRPAHFQTPGKRSRRRPLPVAGCVHVRMRLKSHGPKVIHACIPLHASCAASSSAVPTPAVQTYISRVASPSNFPRFRKVVAIPSVCALLACPRLPHQLLTRRQPLSSPATWPNSRRIAPSAGCLAIGIHGWVWKPQCAHRTLAHQRALTTTTAPLETIAPQWTMQLSRR